MPLLYYMRHGETDWNVAGRLQGQKDIPVNARGREQASRCGEVLHDLFARDQIDPARLDFIASPLERARETMELARDSLGLDPSAYAQDERLAEICFGDWEGFTTDELRQRVPEVYAERERDKWNFTPPKGESYATMSLRVREWYGTLLRDTVAVAHGGTLRGLVVQLGICSTSEAPFLDVAQGVVYLIEPGRISRYT